MEEAWERIQQQRKEYQEFRRENSHDQAAIEQYESRLESKIESLFDEQAEKYVAERLQNKVSFSSDGIVYVCVVCEDGWKLAMESIKISWFLVIKIVT